MRPYLWSVIEPNNRATMNTYTWTAKNNSSFLNGTRSASSKIAAVRAAKAYVRGELYGEGTATIYCDGQPVEQHERSIFTGMTWKKNTI